MAYLLLHTDRVSIRRISDEPFPEEYLDIYSQVEIPDKTKTELENENKPPIKCKVFDKIVYGFYQDDDLQWKKIVNFHTDYEFNYEDGIVIHNIKNNSDNKTVATAEEMEGAS